MARPETSGRAYQATLHNAGAHRRLIAAVVNAAQNDGKPGLNADEIEERTGLPHQTCSARTTEMVQDGMLEDTGMTSRTRRGQQARILRLGHAPRTGGGQSRMRGV